MFTIGSNRTLDHGAMPQAHNIMELVSLDISKLNRTLSYYQQC